MLFKAKETPYKEWNVAQNRWHMAILHSNKMPRVNTKQKLACSIYTYR